MDKTYVDEIVGGDGIRRYDLVRDDGSVAVENVQIAKAYVPEQEGTTFGAEDVNTICTEVNGKAALVHTHAASDITAGTLGGRVKASNSAVATLTTGQVRNIIIAASAPTSGIANGDIWLSYST